VVRPCDCGFPGVRKSFFMALEKPNFHILLSSSADRGAMVKRQFQLKLEFTSI